MAKMQAVYRFHIDPDTLEGDFHAYTVDHLFGDVWCRPGLELTQRRLLTVGALAALGSGDLLEVQFQSALDNGELTVEQLREVVIHLAHYVGWPRATVVDQAAERVIARRHKG
jgi:4-carboxymuconolactone decarboxylase